MKGLPMDRQRNLIEMPYGILSGRLDLVDGFSVLMLMVIAGCQMISLGFCLLALSVFSVLTLYLSIRLSLPLMLNVRVMDALRYRLALSLVAVASVVFVLGSSAFRHTFSSISLHSVCIAVCFGTVFFAMLSMWYGWRALFLLSLLAMGGLCSVNIVDGIISVVVVSLLSYTAMQSAQNQEAEGLSSMLDRMSGTLLVRMPRFVVGATFLIGFASVLAISQRMNVSDGIRSVVHSFDMCLRMVKGFAVADVVLLFCLAIVAMAALFQVRRATDVFRPLSGWRASAYALAFLAAIGWFGGASDMILGWAKVSSNAPRLLYDILQAITILTASSVFMVEIGCRSDALPREREDGMEPYPLVPKRNRVFFVTALVSLLLALALMMAFVH